MKKLLTILVIAGALLASPYFIGQQTETKIRDMYAQMSDYPSYELEITEYHQGWFGSRLTATFTMPIAAADDLGIEHLSFTLQQEIQHGPLLWKYNGLGFGLNDSSTQIKLDQDMLALLPADLNIADNNLQIIGHIGFNGSVQSIVKLSPFSMLIDEAKLEIKGAEFTSSVAMDGAMTFAGSWQGLTISEDQQTLVELKQLTVSGVQQLIRGELFSPTALTTGDFFVHMAQFSVAGPTPDTVINIEDLSITGASQENDGLLLIDVLFNAENIDAMAQQFNDFNYQITMKNLDVDVFQEVQRVMLEIQELPEQQQAMALMQLQALLPKLIAKAPEFNITQLGINTEDGEVSSDLNIKFDQSIYDANNPMSMILAVDANAKGHAPQAFFERIGMATDVDGMLDQNILVKDNDNVSFNFTFKNGQALLNGMPIPLG